MSSSVADQITKLEAARQLVLSDSTHYSAIVPGILPIIGPSVHVDIRRWGAEFLAEAFASPALSLQGKESLSIQVIQTLQELLQTPAQDVNVVKSVVQAAASIYGLIFRYIINNPADSQTWERMATIKSNILKRWDTAVIGVRVCCIKFVQRVVQVQTPGTIADPRVRKVLEKRPEQNEISLALVPRDHPLIPPPNLEAEASGLLDRLLNVFYEETSDAVLVNATLNCLSVLVRARQSIAHKIVNAVVNFNPLKQGNSPQTPKSRVQVKSMERTTRAFLLNILRRNENGPFAGRIRQHLDRLAQTRLDMFDERSLKRSAPSEPIDGFDHAKRIRLGTETNGRSSVPPLPPGPNSTAQLFTLTTEEALRAFDVTILPIDLVVRITLPVLQRIDQSLLDQAINAVRVRHASLSQTQQTSSQAQSTIPAIAFDEDEDEYDPEFGPTEDREQILNKVDALPPSEIVQRPINLSLGPFKLPPPPPLTTEEASQLGRGTISRVFSMMSVLDEPSRGPKLGLHRLAGSNHDREAWITMITRLATRASSGLELIEDDELEQPGPNGMVLRTVPRTLGDGIRETLWKYIIDDFRVRIPIAIAWLNEEWYHDQMMIRKAALEEAETENDEKKAEGGKRASAAKPNYETWTLKVLDGIIPYLDAKDKVLIRFLSEIPGISDSVVERVKGIARDPDRVTLAVNAIYYLVLLRPPVREMCIDALEDLWRNYDDARAPTTKLLAKWRPGVLEEKKPVNGVVEDAKAATATPPPVQGVMAKVEANAENQKEGEVGNGQWITT